MKDILIEQKKEVLSQIIETEDFKNLVDNTLNLKLKYYNLLNKILPTMYIGDHELSKESMLNYFYQCMFMDEYNDENVVYFIRNQYTGLLKIGKTSNLKRRIKEIERCSTFLGLENQKMLIEAISFCPFGMENGQVENYYHKLYFDKRIKGEWFDISYEELTNTLIYDYIIDGIVVAIEDIYDFPKGVRFVHLEEESDEDALRKNIQKDYISKLCKNLELIEDPFKILNSEKKLVSSEMMYNYIISLAESHDNLDNKIKRRIEHILNFT